MKNIDRLAHHMVKHGSKGIMIHEIPGTSNWLICQCISPNKWILTLGSPLGNVTHNLGSVTDKQYLDLWRELIVIRFEKSTKNIEAAQQFRKYIKNFIKSYTYTYGHFLKKSTQTDTKQKRT